PSRLGPRQSGQSKLLLALGAAVPALIGMKPSRLSINLSNFVSFLRPTSDCKIFCSFSAAIVSARKTVINGAGRVFVITFKLPGLTLPQPSSNGSDHVGITATGGGEVWP